MFLAPSLTGIEFKTVWVCCHFYHKGLKCYFLGIASVYQGFCFRFGVGGQSTSGALWGVTQDALATLEYIVEGYTIYTSYDMLKMILKTMVWSLYYKVESSKHWFSEIKVCAAPYFIVNIENTILYHVQISTWYLHFQIATGISSFVRMYHSSFPHPPFE